MDGVTDPDHSALDHATGSIGGRARLAELFAGQADRDDRIVEWLAAFEARLIDAIDARLAVFEAVIKGGQTAAVPGPTREALTTEEVATLLGKEPATVRGWCRDGRIDAEKDSAGAWRVSRAALAHYRDRGLLPASRGR